jgi:hypothetical protein
VKPLPVEDPGTPDHRTPARYLLWTARTQAVTLADADIAGSYGVERYTLRLRTFLYPMVEDGRITELGTHDELIARGGSYAALWASWHGATPATGSA